MNNTKKFFSALTLLAISTSVNAQELGEMVAKGKPDARKEKCYGIVKAGKNDCAAADGTHSCAGLAKNDGDSREWVLLPAGTCDRLVGGSVNPKI